MLPQKKIRNLRSSTAGNALKLSILPSPCYFCIILNILRSHQADLFGYWGVRTPPHPPPLPTGLHLMQQTGQMICILGVCCSAKNTVCPIVLLKRIVKSFQSLTRLLATIIFVRDSLSTTG